MRGLMLIAAGLALAGCAGVPKGDFRDQEARITSVALFDPVKFADVWHVVAAYGAEADCGPMLETWVQTGAETFDVTGTGCLSGVSRAFASDARSVGPGRFSRKGVSGPEELWVMWVDEGYRVAVIGTPDGRFARVLSRTPDLRGDLMTAAREILSFNGYDPALLQPTALR